MLTALGGLAESERALISARAKGARGEDRTTAETPPHQIREALRRRYAGEPIRDIARLHSVSYSTISRLRQ